jgi:hypothetical protein
MHVIWRVIVRFAPALIVSLFANAIISVGVVIFLVSAFQQVVDTSIESLNSRAGDVQARVSEVNAELSSLLPALQNLESDIAALRKSQDDFVDFGSERIDALAASTDFLLTQAERIVSRVEPSPPVTLGLVELGRELRVSTDGSGTFSASFESASEILLTFTAELAPSYQVPTTFLVTVFSRDPDYARQYNGISSLVVVPDGFSVGSVTAFIPAAGNYFIVVHSVPDVDITILVSEVTEKQ